MSKTFQRRDNKAGKANGRERTRRDFDFDSDHERLQPGNRGVTRRSARDFRFFPTEGSSGRGLLDEGYAG